MGQKSIFQAKISKFFRSCKAIISIAIFIIQEIIFAHKFFLHTLFRASVSDVLPPIKLKIGYGNKLQFKFILLSNEVDSQNFREYIGKKWSLFLGTQVLLSTHKSTGSRLHCEDLNSLFLQIKGEKKWTIVHPDYMWSMYPISKLHMCTSAFNKNDDEQNLDRYFPLYQYCPKYEFILEPGDILFNPTWFWHEVDNLQNETISVANRWISFGVKRTNTFFDLFQLLSPKVWQQQFYGMSRSPDELSLFDLFG